MEFYPPIESRETDELIVISKSSTADYQAIVIELAKKELSKRGLTQMEIDNRYGAFRIEQEEMHEEDLKERAAEDYSLLEKILLIIFWPRLLFRGWYLRSSGYKTKASNRIKLILIGLALYIFVILSSYL